MIDNVNITNFRCFKRLEVAELKKVNLLVGQNSSGKSAFLEAIFLSSSSAAANTAFQLRAIRRMGGLLVRPSDAQAYRSVWEDLFFDFNQDRKISIKIGGTPNSDSRNLWVEYVSSRAQELPFGKQPPTSGVNLEQTNALPQIEFKWKRTGYPEAVARPRFTDTGLQTETSDVTYFPCIWYSPGANETPDENAKRFSDLDKCGDGKLDHVRSAIHKEFPFITGMSIQYHAGLPMMFAEIENKPRKMPFALLSDGINRLLGICLSLAYYTGGTMLIDQFEDGFHYKLLPSIWSSVYKLAKEFKVQMFISTHSKDCMDALLPTIKGNEEDFCLLRASRIENGCDIKALAGSYLESALEQEFEVR